MRHLFLALALAATIGCTSANKPVCEPYPAEWTPAPSTSTSADLDPEELKGLKTPCGQACAQLRTLGCREGFGVKGGKSCYAVCQSTMEKFSTVDPECIRAAKTTTAVRKCHVKCENVP